jgi:RHS repeat-associated protein
MATPRSGDGDRRQPAPSTLGEPGAAAPLERSSTAPTPTEGARTSGFNPPTVSLPKGGGAVRGIGEKFSANPVTGTGSLTIPLPTSPGRSGFGPQLNLSYDSGNKHGPFGMSWSLGLPSITRKTDKGLPSYDDTADRDVFILSGAEDLVPTLRPDGQPERRPRTVQDMPYEVIRYRPRIEGLYARIERWTATRTGEVHWRSISRDNVTTVYGRDANSRIADPADPLRRIFSWLVCESFDDKGNAIVYRYAEENHTDVDLAAAHERNRPKGSRTTNRYLKSVSYGNRVSRLAPPDPDNDGWLFELVFDYGEHDKDTPTPTDTGTWVCRNDPFSSYRSGFEVRTYRLCQRVLMFHHFPGEQGVGKDCLVRSMRLSYRDSRGVASDQQRGHPAGAFLASVTVTGHRRSGDRYLSRSLPPLELTYSTASPDHEVHELDPASLENLPVGVDGAGYQWADIDGVSIAGALTAQAGGWFYKPNEGGGRLGSVQRLPTQPSLPLGDGQGQLLDLAGDGRLDLVDLGGPTPGFFERTDDGGWAPHRPFTSLPALDWNDPNLRFGDVNGDGHADILVTKGEAVVWYPSLGEEGFGAAYQVVTAPDEDAGPRLVFADGTQSVYLADGSGDGLPDLVRVRNGEICYWPNLGYGRFGPKVVMDNSPLFDHPDRFDQRRVRLADLDDTGPIDVLYLGADGVDLYTNQMGNAWSATTRLPAFPAVDELTSVSVVDLLGKGTACLVWSSPLPGDAGRQVRYVDLMGTKPHLLVHMANNLGAETAVTYATSTSFYLRDKAEGRPWVTRLPFPVHVVEKVETFDRINRNRFVTRYRYRDGYFDPDDREFRGFAMVEQDDTEHIAALTRSELFPIGSNVDPAHHLPPVRTRTWFHTGAFLGRDRLSRLFAEQYYPPPEHALPEVLTWLLDDTPMPPGLPLNAERDACRALKGQLLRQEVYALDGSDLEPHPYTVVERNYTIRPLQIPVGSRPGVFAVDPRETVTATCERHPEDARVAHEVVLEVDPYGTVLHSVALAYGRGTPDLTLPERTREVQATTLVTEARVQVTNLVDLPPPGTAQGTDAYRLPVPYDTSTFQVSGRDTDHGVDLDASRARVDRAYLADALDGPLPAALTRRLVTRERIRFQADELIGPLDWGSQQPRGLTHETYRLALPEGIRAAVFGSRVDATMLTAAGYVEAEGAWWVPSGTVRYSPATTGPPLDAADDARSHFFLPRRFVDPFAAVDPAGVYATAVEYDDYDLLPVETMDRVGNTVTAGGRNADGTRAGVRLDYRVLAADLVTDPNRNHTAVAFDALGMVTATAVMGKPEDDTGDRVGTIEPDESATERAAFWADPYGHARSLLGEATTRMVYDLDAYLRSRDDDQPQPVGVATIAREQHVADPAATGPSPLQVSFSYADGAGQPIQQKLPAEPDPTLPPTDPEPGRWVASGWTVLNNKGKPVRRYEPCFTPRHTFEFAIECGVSPVLFYDPPGRMVATLHPNHTYDKAVVQAWQQQSWDVNDTAALVGADGRPAGNPADDPDIDGYVDALPDREYLPTWYRRRIDGDLGAHEKAAAERTGDHVQTPTLTCLDPFGRPVLTVAENRTPADGGTPVATQHRTHSTLDIAGNQLEIADCVDGTPGLTTSEADRLVARYRYDLTGTRLLEESMEAGTRRRLTDIAGESVTMWEVIDDAGAERATSTTYDRLRRPLDIVLRQGGDQITVRRTEYGEAASGAELANLRGRVRRNDDGAGTATYSYDVRGNLTSVSRTLTAGTAYRDVIDWAGNPAMETVTRTGRTAFDALSRTREQTHPDGTVVRYGYNPAGLLNHVEATLLPGGATTMFITNIDYDAKGQRTRIDYGNGVTATYTYEPDTFRLATLRTLRSGRFPDDPQPPDTRRGVQNLAYVYDPAGNITHIEDTAQPRVFNLDTLVEASTDYTYDAVYRLIGADGREHLGLQNGTLAPPTAASAHDSLRVNPANRNALGRYHEHYTYDVAGNLLSLVHHGTNPAHPGWTRTFTYQEPSQLEPARTDVPSNRLTSTSTRNATTTGENYHHDPHGNMDVLPPLQLVRWDYRNQLQATATQRVGDGLVPEITYYCYDDANQRVRWVRDSQATSVDLARPLEERIYLGDFELYRQYDAGGRVTLARSTVHIMDGQQRVALVEIRTDDGATTDPDRQLIRYQHANHLGSSTVELDGTGDFVSYEECYPYGCTALTFWRAGAPPRRFRYTAKERDRTGLYYHGARYYAPWLARWTAPEPSRFADGLCLYRYARDNPVKFVDPTGNESDLAWAAGVLSRSNARRGESETLQAEAAAARRAAQSGDRTAARQHWTGVKNELQRQSNEVMKVGFTVWAFMALAVASGVTGGLVGGAVLGGGGAAGTGAAAPTFGTKVLAAGLSGLSSGAVEVAGEQGIRAVAGERNLSVGEMGVRVLTSTVLSVTVTAVARLISGLRSALVNVAIRRNSAEFSTVLPKLRSVGAAGRESVELEATHWIKESKGFPHPEEFATELAAHRDAIQEIIDTEGVRGLQNRIREYQANKAALEALRSDIHQSLEPLAEGLVYSHHPDMVVGADPFAIGRLANARVNSILGAASKQWAQQLLKLDPNASVRISLKAVIQW